MTINKAECYSTNGGSGDWCWRIAIVTEWVVGAEISDPDHDFIGLGAGGRCPKEGVIGYICNVVVTGITVSLVSLPEPQRGPSLIWRSVYLRPSPSSFNTIVLTQRFTSHRRLHVRKTLHIILPIST